MAEPTNVDIDLVAASLRADLSDVHTFVESLAAKLEEMLPGAVRVDRGRKGLRGPKRVRTISVDLSGERLGLTRSDHDALACTCSRVSGGIVLKTEEVGFDDWLDTLGRSLAAEAEKSASMRQALERLLLG